MEKFTVALLGVSLVLVFAVLFALPTQLLWNWALAPAIEGVNSIGFWQALGINMLATILFKGADVSSK